MCVVVKEDAPDVWFALNFVMQCNRGDLCGVDLVSLSAMIVVEGDLSIDSASAPTSSGKSLTPPRTCNI
jgi:hypothetical protein